MADGGWRIWDVECGMGQGLGPLPLPRSSIRSPAGLQLQGAGSPTVLDSDDFGCWQACVISSPGHHRSQLISPPDRSDPACGGACAGWPNRWRRRGRSPQVAPRPMTSAGELSIRARSWVPGRNPAPLSSAEPVGWPRPEPAERHQGAPPLGLFRCKPDRAPSQTRSDRWPAGLFRDQAESLRPSLRESDRETAAIAPGLVNQKTLYWPYSTLPRSGPANHRDFADSPGSAFPTSEPASHLALAPSIKLDLRLSA